MLEYINKLLELDEDWEKKVFGIMFRIQLCFYILHSQLFLHDAYVQWMWKCRMSVWPSVILVCYAETAVL